MGKRHNANERRELYGKAYTEFLCVMARNGGTIKPERVREICRSLRICVFSAADARMAKDMEFDAWFDAIVDKYRKLNKAAAERRDHMNEGKDERPCDRIAQLAVTFPPTIDEMVAQLLMKVDTLIAMLSNAQCQQ